MTTNYLVVVHACCFFQSQTSIPSNSSLSLVDTNRGLDIVTGFADFKLANANGDFADFGSSTTAETGEV